MKTALKRFIKSEISRTTPFVVKRNRLCRTEEDFCIWANSRMWPVHRPSWPDFLIEMECGELVAVEVKGPGDWVRINQRRTFDFLMGLGLRIFIWDATKNEPLIPWEIARTLPGRRRKR